MRNVFRDPALEEQFRRDGYVVIDFLDAERVTFLREQFFELLPISGGNITADETGRKMDSEITYDFTFIDRNPDYKRKVFDLITARLGTAMEPVLDGYKPIIANYIRKKTEKGEVPLHQNWAFADESKCSTVSIWCPLVDATIQNGTLQVVPGSHKRFGQVRGPMVPWELENIKDEIIEKYLVPIEIPAGKAIVLDDSIVHYSAINKTEELRLAIQLICIPDELPSLHHHMNHAVSSAHVEILEVDKEFYMEFNPWKFPSGTTCVDRFEYSPRYIDEAAFAARLYGPRYDMPPAVERPFSAGTMKLFKDPELQRRFDEDGYVKIPLVGATEVAALNDLFYEVRPEAYKGFFSTIYDGDTALKKETGARIGGLLHESIQRHFHGHTPLGCSFLCKTPGQESRMPVHQDWTIVDESKYASVTVWIPLVDTDEYNGAMRVLPGSHRFSDVLRSPTLPGVFGPLSDDIYGRMKWVKAAAGEAVVFNHALLHASPPNLTQTDRPVATYGLVPAEADLHFYHRREDGKVEKYEVPQDFFMTYNNIGGVPENGTKTGEFNYGWTEWDGTRLEAAIKKYRTRNMRPLFKNPDVQAFFNVNGFVRIPMLDENDVKTLLDYFHDQNLRDRSGYGFNMSMEDEDKVKVARIREKIFETALPKAMQHLVNARVIAGSYVVKEPNPQGVVPPHQDWTFVDNEGDFYSVTCWIPLVPTRLENGYMGVIKGSHLIYDNTRPSPSPQVPTPLMNHLFSIFPYLEMYEMRPGEALIFDHRTFHASTPNITDDPRIAIGLGFTQADAELRHYTLKPDGNKDTLLKYKIDDAFLLKYDNALLSKMYDRNEPIAGYDVDEEIPYVYPNPTSDELVSKIKEAGNRFNVELCEHMAKLFGYAMNGTQAEKVEPEQPVAETAGTPEEAARPFWKVYTPMNILREIKYRVTGS